MNETPERCQDFASPNTLGRIELSEEDEKEAATSFSVEEPKPTCRNCRRIIRWSDELGRWQHVLINEAVEDVTCTLPTLLEAPSSDGCRHDLVKWRPTAVSVEEEQCEHLHTDSSTTPLGWTGCLDCGKEFEIEDDPAERP